MVVINPVTTTIIIIRLSINRVNLVCNLKLVPERKLRMRYLFELAWQDYSAFGPACMSALMES